MKKILLKTAIFSLIISLRFSFPSFVYAQQASIRVAATDGQEKVFPGIPFQCSDAPPAKQTPLISPPIHSQHVTGADGSFTWMVEARANHKYSCAAKNVPQCYYPLPGQAKNLSLSPGETKNLSFIFKQDPNACPVQQSSEPAETKPSPSIQPSPIVEEQSSPESTSSSKKTEKNEEEKQSKSEKKLNFFQKIIAEITSLINKIIPFKIL